MKLGQTLRYITVLGFGLCMWHSYYSGDTVKAFLIILLGIFTAIIDLTIIADFIIKNAQSIKQTPTKERELLDLLNLNERMKDRFVKACLRYGFTYRIMEYQIAFGRCDIASVFKYGHIISNYNGIDYTDYQQAYKTIIEEAYKLKSTEFVAANSKD